MLIAGVWSKVTSFFALRDPEDEYDDEFMRDDNKAGVVQLSEARSRRVGGVSVFLPRRYDDVTEVADALRSRMVVVVNLVGADRLLSQRLVDFLSGVVYTLDGKMHRVAEGIYLFAPSNVPISAQELESAAAPAYSAY